MVEEHSLDLSPGHLQDLNILGFTKNPIKMRELFNVAVNANRLELALNTLLLEVRTGHFQILMWNDLADELNEIAQIESEDQEKEVLRLLAMYVNLLDLPTKNAHSFLYFLQLIDETGSQKPEIITDRVKSLMNNIVETVANIREEFLNQKEYLLGVYTDSLEKLKQFRSNL